MCAMHRHSPFHVMNHGDQDAAEIKISGTAVVRAEARDEHHVPVRMHTRAEAENKCRQRGHGFCGRSCLLFFTCNQCVRLVVRRGCVYFQSEVVPVDASTMHAAQTILYKLHAP